MGELVIPIEAAVFNLKGNPRHVSFGPSDSIHALRTQVREGDWKVLVRQKRSFIVPDSSGNVRTFTGEDEYGRVYINPQEILTPDGLESQGVVFTRFPDVSLYVRALDSHVYPLFPEDGIVFVDHSTVTTAA